MPPDTTAKPHTMQCIAWGAHIHAKNLLSLFPGQAVLPHHP